MLLWYLQVTWQREADDGTGLAQGWHRLECAAGCGRAGATSELIHSLLPIFMTTALGASMVTVGIVEGVAQATAALTRVFRRYFCCCDGMRAAGLP